ncbi:hypothetical protein CC86DRAFT_375932 [Ophiobolus disseminans]|uniref:Uncharacterized protein n=1 Tax=Ophiobolus disseminans TaxID=1469910 RepID=A0A6A6ZC37_9PLEO|nr:hypothetical protein CC86DRAFT_375932 [Ophiobolus disseminans]
MAQAPEPCSSSTLYSLILTGLFLPLKALPLPLLLVQVPCAFDRAFLCPSLWQPSL